MTDLDFCPYCGHHDLNHRMDGHCFSCGKVCVRQRREAIRSIGAGVLAAAAILIVLIIVL